MRAGVTLAITVLLPFLGALCVPALARTLGKGLGAFLCVFPITILALNLPRLGETGSFWSVPWVPELGLSLSFRSDPLALTFTLLIATVGLAVFPYAGAYLGPDRRFFVTLLAFMGSMLGVVLADDLLLLFIFWELTSVTSFLLISHHAEKPAARRAAQQAFLVTFVGGLALLPAAVLIGLEAGTTRISDIPSNLSSAPVYIAIVLCVLTAAFTKSAQIPFHFWLPNAMEAPTPVSAFLHSATMVQAGIFLVARLDPFLGGTELWMNALTGVGCATALVGGGISLLQTDLKRLLAYSTVGALGLLTAAVGQRAWSAFFVFFVAHGFYKSAMFLLAGALEHGAGTRDARILAGLKSAMPTTRALALVAALSMAALPPTLGYLGKEEMLLAGTGPFLATTVAYGAASVAVAFIVGIRPFLGQPNREAHEVPPAMRFGVGLPALLGLVLFAAVPFLRSPIVFHYPGAASLITWLAGAALAYLWSRKLNLTRPPRYSLDHAYDHVRSAGAAFARVVVRRVQHGYLNGYVRATFGTFAVLVLYGIARVWPAPSPQHLESPTFYEAAIGVAMIVGAVTAVLSTSRLGAVAALGIVGYGVALIYVRFGAPDLAMTQIAVETLTLILFVLTFYYLPKTPPRRNPGPRLRDGLVAGAVGLTMTAVTVIASGIPNDGLLNRYFSEHALSEGKGRNVVNVILVDFRGFDTLGEITVLAIAGLGVFALLRMPRRGGGPSVR